MVKNPPLYLFKLKNAHRSSSFPAAELRFLLVVSSRHSFFTPPFCCVPSVLVVKSCTCLFQIPCLLSMHSERVLFCFFSCSCHFSFTCHDWFRCGGHHQTVFPSFFFPSIFYSKRKKCLVTSTNEFFFSCYCLRGSSGLDEDSTVSVEFEDLAQPLLGRCHPFFGPLACKENGQNVVMASI